MTEENDCLIMPPLMLLEDFDGDFSQYMEAVYAIFKRDFVDSKPNWEGKRFALKKYPMEFGKEHTFYHITHEGDEEENRKPDLRRMERIAFPRVMIDHVSHPILKVWQNIRGDKHNILILHEEEKYLIVLREHEDYVLLWTAYYIEYSNRMRRLVKEYEEFIKSKDRT